ncbi:hypothetical protein [Natronorubrum aibiense]|uniref:Uncharacterized protein n=1 Tax=Natronorubrum aibiense TaxID=348826 RepID=A0A5P9P6G9_9EURY|nr:hypothetical protein [Natronorubrum aibiense]QFU83390.1 hypothetical protein GCU68_12990 [Natronorubrum aibiense]
MQGGLSDGIGPGEVAATTTTTTSSPADNAQQPPASPTERLVYGTAWTQDDIMIALLTLQVVLLIFVTIRA